MLSKIAGEYGIVAKVDVSDMDASVIWYKSKLDLVLDKGLTRIPTWRQLNAPGISRFAIGLNLNPKGVGTQGATTTIVVDHIKKARQLLIDKGVDVGPITSVGEGVKLAFFHDPDGNSLALRQNSTEEPNAASIGWQAS